MPNSTQILNHQKIEQIITRIAYQIYENNHLEKEIVIAGIKGKGFVFAQLLAEKLKSISSIDILLEQLHVNKKSPINSIVELNISQDIFTDKVIIVVDDVLNSGQTMMYGLQHFLSAPVKKLATAVLVNRSYKRYPVHANYIGISLATTMQEHIEVSFESGNYAAYLN